MRALRDTALLQNDFFVKKIFTLPNKARPTDEFLNKKIKALMKNNKGAITFSDNPKDSLSYFMRLRNQPKEIDSIAEKELTGAEFIRSISDKIENIKGKFEVTYKEHEEYGYLKYVDRKYTKRQKSVFHFLSDPLKIYENGYYEDVRTLFMEGYLSWHEKMSNLLPQEYHPKEKPSE